MSPPLIALPWVGSLIVVAVLSFRLGMWWKGIRRHGRHRFTSDGRHGDDPWSAEWTEDVAGERGEADRENGINQAMQADTDPIEPPPATTTHERWWRDDVDTEVLPRIQDIVPPVRATPIQRPPWVGKDDRYRD